MIKFLMRRAIFLVATVFGISVAVFLIAEAVPSNIAVNTLGNTITPEQEASFNAQNGLDQPLLTRYIRWMFGSDFEAASAIDKPVVRLYDEENERYRWWVQGDDGSYYQSFSEDGETIIHKVLQPDNTTVDAPQGDDVWRTEGSQEVYWGIDEEGRAAMWVRGAGAVERTFSAAGWRESFGAPSAYIPLQKGLLRGDPGRSFKDRRPVAEVLVRRLMATLYLAGIAFVIVMPIALLLGVIAGLYEGYALDRGLTVASLIATATPEFASGVFLILIFSTWLGWFPGAVVALDDNAIYTNPQMLVLPVLTLTLIELGYVLRITRASMVEVMRTNYIRTAVLKGLPQQVIIFKHALRNALLAPITIITLHINWLIGGIVVTEVLFSYPGLGRYVLDAALFGDIYALEAAAMVLVIIAVGSQLLADMLYTYLNPRIRYS